MDIFAAILNLLNNPSSAFLIGLAAAFTPCTMAIFPIFLYRFGMWGENTSVKKNYRDLAIAMAAFILSFALTGLVLQQIIVSEFANIFRLGLGTMLIFVGLMQLSGKLNLQTISKISHPVAVGAFLPWVLSFSPCVLAFTANLLVAAAGTAASTAGTTAWQFTLFGGGMLTPVAAMVLIGNSAMGAMRKSQSAMKWVEKLSPYLIIGSGIYLSSQLVQITSAEVLGAGLFLSIIWLFMAYKSRLWAASGLNLTLGVFTLLTLILVTVISYTITLPYDATALSGKELLYACVPGQHQTSEVAIPLSILYGLFAVVLAIWYQNRNRRLGFKLSFGLVKSPTE